MIRVGFLGYEANYQGGINYLKNLFYAVKQLDNPKIEIIAFVGKKDDYQAELYGKYIKVLRTSLLDRYSFLWFLNRFFWRLVNYPLVVDILLRLHRIDVLSHSNFTSKFIKAKTIHWIPDFQPLILSHLWREEEVETWKKVFIAHIKNTDLVLLSSNSALKSYLAFAPQYEQKVRVVHFVSQPSTSLKEINMNEIRIKYGIDKKFFYLPNQFWKHKNHRIVFEAVLILKQSISDVTVICTGLMEDFRNGDNTHVQKLLDFIEYNDLRDNIKTLGMVDYQEVLWFMKNAIAIINPSFFEGWSSTVEEAKSIGQNIILSSIDVHKEQNPELGIYFDPDNAIELSNILQQFWIDGTYGLVNVEKDLEKRTLEFAKSYQEIVEEVIG